AWRLGSAEPDGLALRTRRSALVSEPRSHFIGTHATLAQACGRQSEDALGDRLAAEHDLDLAGHVGLELLATRRASADHRGVLLVVEVPAGRVFTGLERRGLGHDLRHAIPGGELDVHELLVEAFVL